MNIKLLIIGLIALSFTGCKKFVEEDVQLIRSADLIYTDPVFAQGFVLQAYRTIPPYYNNSDLATDDAVANVQSNAFNQIATGSWTPTNLTLSVWNGSYSSILYINQFLEAANKAKFAVDPAANKLLNFRIRGEAFGLRALHMFYLLRHHAGVTPDGQLMGVPIVTKYQDPASTDFNLPRNTFDECVKQIYRDLDSAELYLPMEYVEITTAAQIPAYYASINASVGSYNQAMGQRFRQLFNGLIARSFRSKTALLAASPAFQHASNPATWEQAANAAAEVIRYKLGVNALPDNGYTFYNNATEIDALSVGINPSEIIWREVRNTNNSTRETENFPPSLFGNGLINPTENLVEAFPMANGYPIGHGSANYVAGNPYANRDPRLRAHIMYNAHPDHAAIRTGSQSGTPDGINVRTTSTRTGYYLKKTLRSDVSLTPGSVVGRNRYTPRIRYTEIYLNYAEAANEAWGPKGTGPNAFSAYDVIKRIRTRAGVGTSTTGVGSNHAYLEECATDKAKMRELIKNERRLELSFEGFRFWDLRRWKENLSKLNETARGMDVNGTVYNPFNVDTRAFQSHMIYGPIPNSEVLKYSNLKQNANW